MQDDMEKRNSELSDALATIERLQRQLEETQVRGVNIMQSKAVAELPSSLNRQKKLSLVRSHVTVAFLSILRNEEKVKT